MRHLENRNLSKGLAAGVAGGLVASWVMTEFQNLWAKSSEAIAEHQEGAGARQRTGKQKQQSEQEQEDATMKAASAVSRNLLGHNLSHSEKRKAGPIVHYAFGTAVGGLYGAVAEFLPEIKNGLGIPFSAALFVGADELAVPAFGLSKPPQEAPLSQHVYGLVSHFVYGITTELVRRGTRAALGA